MVDAGRGSGSSAATAGVGPRAWHAIDFEHDPLPAKALGSYYFPSIPDPHTDMVLVPGTAIELHVICDGKPLPEFATEVEGTNASCFVPSVVGKASGHRHYERGSLHTVSFLRRSGCV